MKEEGYIDSKIEFHDKAIDDLARRFYTTAYHAYEIGFKSGIRQTLQAIRDEEIAVKHTADSITISSKLEKFPIVKPFAGVVFDLDSKRAGRLLSVPIIQMSDVLGSED